jgi:hypothetical protein
LLRELEREVATWVKVARNQGASEVELDSAIMAGYEQAVALRQTALAA